MAKPKQIEESAPAPVPVAEIKDLRVRRSLDRLCTEYRELAAQEAAITAAKSALMDEIKVIAAAHDLHKVAGTSWLLTEGRGGSSKIKAELLLAKGVPMKIIEAATETKSWTYFQVLERKDIP